MFERKNQRQRAASHELGRAGGSGRNAAAEFPAFHGSTTKAAATWAVGRSISKILLGNGNVWEALPVLGVGDELGQRWGLEAGWVCVVSSESCLHGRSATGLPKCHWSLQSGATHP